MLASTETRDISYQQVANVLLFMAIYSRPSIQCKEFCGSASANTDRTATGLARCRARSIERTYVWLSLNSWQYTTPSSLSRTNRTTLISSYFGRYMAERDHTAGILMCFLSCTPDELDVSQIPRLRAAFTLKMFDQASDEIKATADRAAKHPYVSLDATTALFSMIFRSSESYSSAQMLGIRMPSSIHTLPSS